MSSSPLSHAAHGELRRLRDEDADDVAALFAQAFGDARSLDAEEIRTWLRNPELDQDLLRVLEVDGRVVGYGDLWIDAGMVELDVAAPGHWDAFLDWAEETARERAVPLVRASSRRARARTCRVRARLRARPYLRDDGGRARRGAPARAAAGGVVYGARGRAPTRPWCARR